MTYDGVKRNRWVCQILVTGPELRVSFHYPYGLRLRGLMIPRSYLVSTFIRIFKLQGFHLAIREKSARRSRIDKKEKHTNIMMLSEDQEDVWASKVMG